MKIYFDSEFTGLHKNTTLISIGLIDEIGRSFYAEFSDYDKYQCDDWIKENVLANLIYKDHKWTDKIADTQVHGTKEEIAKALREWLSYYKKPINELVSDVCHYDMVLFISIFGTAFDLPKNISPVCHDINADIARYLKITETEAFDESREGLLARFGVTIEGRKHNALYDAFVIRALDFEIRAYELHEQLKKSI